MPLVTSLINYWLQASKVPHVTRSNTTVMLWIISSIVSP